MKVWFFLCLLSPWMVAEGRMAVWITQGDQSKLLQREPDLIPTKRLYPEMTNPIKITPSTRFQAMKGFGAAISNAAAHLMYYSPKKDEIIRDLFDPVQGRGIGYLRLVMGGSDFNAVQPYTYDDINPIETDYELKSFSIEKDRAFVLPLLKEILKVNPEIGIMASPWTAPAWMKDNKSLNGGSLKGDDKVLNTLSEYFVRFIQAYADEGISIDTLTLQNEPTHASDGYPTMLMSTAIQSKLVKLVGQAFERNNISTELIIYDHNWDDVEYPLDVLADPEAKKYVKGTAWHCYGGDRNAPREVTSRHPETDVYFTECSGGEWDTNFANSLGWNLENLFMGQTRVGARTVLLWNMALDSNFGPRVGVTTGCTNCRGVITVDGDDYQRNIEYYLIGHFSSFVKKGAIRIDSTRYAEKLDTVAFENPDKSIVLVVFNASWEKSETLYIQLNGVTYRYQDIPKRSVITFITQKWE